jgi:low temperature requirement protein LtrA
MATEVHEESEQRVTPLELFFDLVFVLSLTQVTARMAKDPSWSGLLEGMLVLAAVWWAWGAYAWLTNTVNSDEGVVRGAMFAAMGAMLIASLAVPYAFEKDAVVFGIAYLAVRVVHLWLYHLAGRDDPALHQNVLKMAPGAMAGALLIIGAGFLDEPLAYALWGLALALDYSAPLIAGTEGWRLHAGHFAERHGLIIIIALGESIVAVGAGIDGLEVGSGIVLAALLAIGVICALWWAYFDVVAIVAERKLHEAQGSAKFAQARDAYSYLHLPMMAGIVLFALGAKKTLGELDEPLKWVPATALCGGVALYLLAHVAFRWRNVRSINKQRVAASVVLLALIPAAHEVDSLVAMAMVCAVCAVLIAYEAVHFREARARIRHATA